MNLNTWYMSASRALPTISSLSHVLWGHFYDWGVFKCQRLAADCWEHILSSHLACHHHHHHHHRCHHHHDHEIQDMYKHMFSHSLKACFGGPRSSVKSNYCFRSFLEEKKQRTWLSMILQMIISKISLHIGAKIFCQRICVVYILTLARYFWEKQDLYFRRRRFVVGSIDPLE